MTGISRHDRFIISKEAFIMARTLVLKLIMEI